MKTDFIKVSYNHQTAKKKIAAALWLLLTSSNSVSINIRHLHELHEINTWCFETP